MDAFLDIVAATCVVVALAVVGRAIFIAAATPHHEHAWGPWRDVKVRRDGGVSAHQGRACRGCGLYQRRHIR